MRKWTNVRKHLVRFIRSKCPACFSKNENLRFLNIPTADGFHGIRKGRNNEFSREVDAKVSGVASLHRNDSDGAVAEDVPGEVGGFSQSVVRWNSSLVVDEGDF